MPVKVNISRNGSGTSTEDTTHTNADVFMVRDQHLLVYASAHSDAALIAVYAPGCWTDARLITDK